MPDSEVWSNYYSITKNRKPRELFLDAIQLISDHLPKKALEMGFGAGNEVLALLENDWTVIAVDAEEKAVELLESRIENDNYNQNLSIITSSFEKVKFEPISFIHAGFSLPFCHPQHFPKLWDEMTSNLEKTGIFSGQLFGKNDEWKDEEGMTFHSNNEVEKLLSEFEIIHLEEIEELRKTATGKDKYWHFFNIIARKK